MSKEMLIMVKVLIMEMYCLKCDYGFSCDYTKSSSGEITSYLVDLAHFLAVCAKIRVTIH